MRKIALIMTLALLLCGAFAVSAQADLLLDFTIPTPLSQLHNLSLTGGASLATNANMSIPVNLVTGVVSPNSAPPLTITDGQLTFNTGPLLTLSPTELTFTPGGQIKITGNIGFGIETLLIGTFVGSPELDISSQNPTLGAFNASFTDSKDEELLAHFGIPSTTELSAGYGGLLTLQISGLPSPIAPSTTLNSLSGNVTNVPAPIPPSALLLGSGLLGLAGWRRLKG